jgi:Ca-activated chloride channel family protein
MDGPSIRQAKRALVLALDDLGDDDLFNIIAFNDDYWKVFPKPAQADSRGIGAAKAAIDRLAAGGGTEMMPALIEALTEPEAEDRLRQIVFITDGAIGYEDQLAATIKKLAGDARFFAIGIGAAPNAHLMRYIAMAGRGSYTFIDDVNAVERELSTLFRKMSTPVLTDLELVLPEGLDAEMLPKALPDLLSGEPISIAIKSAQPLTTFRIEGRRGDQGWRRTVAIKEPRLAEGIGKIFARRKIQALRFDNLGTEDQEAREEITRLAIRHQMISDYTSLVAVDEAILRPMSEPLLQKRHEPTLPLGWQEDRLKALEAEALYRRLQEEPSANGADAPTNQLLQPISLPQTAAGFQLYLMIGFLLLLAGGALLFLTQRQRHA